MGPQIWGPRRAHHCVKLQEEWVVGVTPKLDSSVSIGTSGPARSKQAKKGANEEEGKVLGCCRD